MVEASRDDDSSSGIPFREKRAWLALASSALVYGAWLLAVGRLPTERMTLVQILVRIFVLFAVALASQGVIVAAGKPLLALRDRAEAKAPPDERDRAIGHRAAVIAYLFLMAEVQLLALATPLVGASWRFTVAAILMMVLADAVRCTAVIALYRSRHG